MVLRGAGFPRALLDEGHEFTGGDFREVFAGKVIKSITLSSSAGHAAFAPAWMSLVDFAWAHWRGREGHAATFAARNFWISNLTKYFVPLLFRLEASPEERAALVSAYILAGVPALELMLEADLEKIGTAVLAKLDRIRAAEAP